MLKHLTTALLLSAITLAVPAQAAMYGSSSPSSSGSAGTASTTHATSAPWHRAKTAKGTIWVDSRGFALYTFAKDTAGVSKCTGACAIAWPPFDAAAGAKASGKWTLVTRPMGVRQWAYNGRPLYFWFKDTKPGAVTGDGLEGFHVAR